MSIAAGPCRYHVAMPGPVAMPPGSVIAARQSQPPRRLRFLFEISDDPIWSHPIWTEHEHTYPCVRVDVRTQRTAEGKHTWAPAAGPHGTVEATLKALHRLIEGFGPVLGPANRPFRWYCQPAGFGGSYEAKHHEMYPNVIALLNHPEDRLGSGRRGPWARRGIELNRIWSTEYLELLAAELARRRLPDPVAFILASENGVKDDQDGHLGKPDRGWVPEALRDRRADDPDYTIDGTFTFKRYFEQARCLDGSPVPEYDDSAQPAIPPGRHPKNHESTERHQGAMRRVWEYSRFKAFAEPAMRAFARDASRPELTVRVGEYQAACDSKASPAIKSPTLRMHQMDGFFRCSLQCPDWYGEISWLLDDAIFTPNHPGWGTLTNWCRALDVTERDPKRRVQLAGLEMAKRSATAHAGAAPHSALAPYVNDLSNIPTEDMVDYLRHCRDLGAWGVNIFMPESTRGGHDRWQRVIEEMERA
jgi:hypothetical protein